MSLEILIAGMLAGCDELGATPVAALVAGASLSGIIAAEVYDALKREILEGIRGAGAVDAIALALHGAGLVDGIDDLEGELVGPEVKVVATTARHHRGPTHRARVDSCGRCDRLDHEAFGGALPQLAPDEPREELPLGRAGARKELPQLARTFARRARAPDLHQLAERLLD